MSNCIDTMHMTPIPSRPQLGGAVAMGRAEWIGQQVGRAIDSALISCSGTIASFLSAILEWQRRSQQRADLAGLDDYLLKDIGLSRADVDNENSKGFWVP